jgi:hypothetical protein
MRRPRVGRGWVEAGLVGLAGADGCGYDVIDFQDDPFGTAVAVVSSALHRRKLTTEVILLHKLSDSEVGVLQHCFHVNYSRPKKRSFSLGDIPTK